jgi:acyl-CoA thioesterase YciA
VRKEAIVTVDNTSAREAVIRTIAMPSDINPAGDIFGGWLMSQMDLAAGNAAARRARGRCVTVAVDGMVFHTPVHVGDEVSVYADLISTGRTSMKFRVEAWRRSRDGTSRSRWRRQSSRLLPSTAALVRAHCPQAELIDPLT